MKESRTSYYCTPIDRLLSDLYEQSLSLKGYLRRLGFTEVETQHLVRNCMTDVSTAIRTILRTLLVMKFADSKATILLENRYCLANTQTNIHDESSLTHERTEDDNTQLIGKTIQLLKERTALKFLENDFRDQMARLLLINPVRSEISLPIKKEMLILPKKASDPQMFIPKKMTTEKDCGFTEIRKNYPRAYEKWSKKEDEELVELRKLGKPIREMAVYFQRKSGAITSRLRKIELRELKGE